MIAFEYLLSHWNAFFWCAITLGAAAALAFFLTGFRHCLGSGFLKLIALSFLTGLATFVGTLILFFLIAALVALVVI